MEILEEKIIDARMVGLDDGVRYLRMNTFPGSATFSWFKAASTLEFPNFQFVWMGKRSQELEEAYQEIKNGPQ